VLIGRVYIGKLNGKNIVYNYGYIICIRNYKNDELDGEYISYNNISNKIDEIKRYKNNKLNGKAEFYYRDLCGSLYLECNYEDDKLNGTV